MRGVDWTFNQIDMGAMTWKPLDAELSSPAFLHLVRLRQALEPYWTQWFEEQIAKQSVQSDQFRQLLTEAKLRAGDFIVQEEPKIARRS